MIDLLQREFVNAWVLAKDLEAIAAREGEDIAQVCKLVKQHYAYPVDSVVLGADLRVHGHVNTKDPSAFDPEAYLAFLRQGLAAAGRTVATPAVAGKPAAGAARPARQAPRSLVVTPEQPSTSLLDVFRAQGFGQPSMSFVGLDATAFADGGVLEIEVRVGSGSGAGRFELCVAVETPAAPGGRAARTMQPVKAIDPVGRETTQKLVHEFAKGARFGLAVMPAPGTVEGDGNAFLATVTVRRP